MHSTLRALSVLMLMFSSLLNSLHAEMTPKNGNDKPVQGSQCNIALKTNLVYDALLVPSLGVELSLSDDISLSASGVWSWWSNSSSFWFWRIYGGRIEGRWWPMRKSDLRTLSGHHIGLYGSVYMYDFKAGTVGFQSPEPNYSAGICYGYSFPIAKRLNIDVSGSIGYIGGKVTKYRTICDVSTCIKRFTHNYVGPTSVEVTLTWFPGRGDKNLPVASDDLSYN